MCEKLIFHGIYSSENESQAHDVLVALGFDAAHRRISYALPLPLFDWNRGSIFNLFLVVGALSAFGIGKWIESSTGNPSLAVAIGLVVASLLGAVYLSFWRRARLCVTFGSDGLLTTQWGKTFLFRWSDVAKLEPWAQPRGAGTTTFPSEGFDLVFSSGKRLRFATLDERQRAGVMEDPVLRDLQEAMNATRAAEDSNAPALPKKGDASANDWLAELRRIGEGAGGGMRVAAVDPDELWRVVEDPNAPPLDRGAAAAALTASKDESTKKRLRVVANATVSAPLRSAIESAAAGDDPELADRLEELSIRDE